MHNAPMVFVDIETNGKMGIQGRIIEIGVIRVEQGEITEIYQSLVNPGGNIPTSIEQLTGISNNDLVHAPYFDEISEKLKDLFSGAIFVAHNVRFDYSFLKSHFKATGYDYKPKLFCTVRMSRALYPNHRGHSLEKIIQRHGIQTSSRHRAYDDAKAMYDFTQLAISEHGIDAFENNLLNQLKTRSLPPNVDQSTVENLPSQPGIYIFNDERGSPLYIGKSVNIRERVKSHFTSDTRIIKEMKLAQRSYSIDFEVTDTEIEALLLESAKVKELSPLLNRKLRRKTQQSILKKSNNENNYATITVESQDLNDNTDITNIYGVYTSRAKAKKRLEELTKTFSLCPKLMGLENAVAACFRYQLGLCKGACIGKEPEETYNLRVELALERSKIDSWPFKSKISVKISETKSLIINQWIIEGIMHHEFEPFIERISNGFDIDTYKILRQYLRKNNNKILPYPDIA